MACTVVAHHCATRPDILGAAAGAPLNWLEPRFPAAGGPVCGGGGVQHEIQDTDATLADPELRELINFSEPCAILPKPGQLAHALVLGIKSPGVPVMQHELHPRPASSRSISNFRSAGSSPARLRICHTVDGATVTPSPASSP